MQITWILVYCITLCNDVQHNVEFTNGGMLHFGVKMILVAYYE